MESRRNRKRRSTQRGEGRERGGEEGRGRVGTQEVRSSRMTRTRTRREEMEKIVNGLKLLRGNFDRLRYDTAQKFHLTQWELTSFIECDSGIFESSITPLNLASCSC
ncbi:hypothetical protein PoB_001171500 [Plakobranchus ocellatus]|uniref:Uncharacterized protein n=1 Tax=Plakobranchus ocellatus TaxID=259542 RepID=A0AAV3YRY4_9GAST|nr:hypothetical protein PoB_001171500 [Plakobranchus ocellatus]